MAVLILAEDIDATCDGVINALQERGQVVHRVNTAWFPAQLTVSARLRLGYWTGHLRTPGRVIELEEITAVWCRTPRAYQFPAGLSTAEKAHANLEAKYGLGGLLASLPVLWVNHPARLASAAYKPHALAIAQRCGLTVPDTLVTNDAEAIREFAAGGETVTKFFGSNTILEDGVRKLSFTRLLSDTDLADLRGVDITMHQLQRFVPKFADVRVTVIGEHITAAAIRSGSPEGYIDFRADYDDLAYELIDPPADVSAGIRSLMIELGLVYGALDFVIERDTGAWWHLEINAGGQFGFVEDATGAPLTAQLADLLSKGTS